MKIRSALIKLYSTVFGKHTRLVSDRTYVRTLYFLSFGRFPSLSAPKTFNEHICTIKLSNQSLAYSAYTDKYAVRDYVEKTVGAEHLTPIYGVYDQFSDIPITELPERFVLKATHASGWNLIVCDKEKLDIADAKKAFDLWMERNYYLTGREKNYKNIIPHIIAETYLEFPQPLTEYKLFCFGGEVKMIAVHRFSSNRHTVNVFTPHWEPLDVKLGYPTETEPLPAPAALDKLLSCAQKLAAPFEFVRVDLYANGDDVRFSELTFTPGGGLVHISPKAFDLTMGSWFDKK